MILWKSKINGMGLFSHDYKYNHVWYYLSNIQFFVYNFISMN